MYRYDEFDHQFVRERTNQFRNQADRRLKGDLTEEEFRPLRLMNGLYLQLHAYMLRVAIPYGTLSSRQMRQLAFIADKWDNYKADMKLVNPANKRKYKVLVVGTGLAGASAAASLAELGYQVEAFCYQDSPRRAHSIAAQGGINAAKAYPNDGDSIYRLFYATIKGGDSRARAGRETSRGRGNAGKSC